MTAGERAAVAMEEAEVAAAARLRCAMSLSAILTASPAANALLDSLDEEEAAMVLVLLGEEREAAAE